VGVVPFGSLVGGHFGDFDVRNLMGEVLVISSFRTGENDFHAEVMVVLLGYIAKFGEASAGARAGWVGDEEPRVGGFSS